MLVKGENLQAREFFIAAYKKYMQCGMKHEATKPLNTLAYANMQCGRMGTATTQLRKCIRFHREHGDFATESIRRMNLASVLRLCGQLTGSLTEYRSVTSYILNHGNKNACDYYLGLAIAQAQQGDTANSIRALDKAEALMVGHDKEMALYHEYAGWVAILSDDYPTAERHLLDGLAISLRIAPESALVSQIKRLMGDLYLATRKFDLAQKYAAEALEVAEKIGQKVEIAACWRVFAQVAVQNGDKPAARTWYKKAMEIFSRISSRYELAATRYLAATSGLYDQQERVAMLHLAKEYFESEEVAPYVAKVKAELAGVTAPHPSPRSAAQVKTRIITSDPAMHRILNTLDYIAPSDMTILLTGETGTGKDLLACYIHERSGRTGAFRTINAAAVPPSLAELELFGSAKGAFTGGTDKAGLLEMAHNGTFFINEVADAPLELQAKLLEVLETHTVRRLGDTKERVVNFRLIAATNHDLLKAVKENRFRTDLYHRLNEVPIHLPPLSDRRDDIPELVRFFLGEVGWRADGNGSAGLVARLGDELARREWPGNVRELRATLRRWYVSHNGDMKELLAFVQEVDQTDVDDNLMSAVAQCDGNQREAARRLGVSESTLRYRLRRRSD